MDGIETTTAPQLADQRERELRRLAFDAWWRGRPSRRQARGRTGRARFLSLRTRATR